MSGFERSARHQYCALFVLYLFGGHLAGDLPAGEYTVSVITEMELLSYPGLTGREENQTRSFPGEVSVAGLTDQIKERAIGLRRRHALKLPDAIIAATALVTGTDLFTNDRKLGQLTDFEIHAVPLMPPPN